MKVIRMCEQVCNNYVGTYNCSCFQGYRLKPNGIGCHRRSISYILFYFIVKGEDIHMSSWKQYYLIAVNSLARYRLRSLLNHGWKLYIACFLECSRSIIFSRIFSNFLSTIFNNSTKWSFLHLLMYNIYLILKIPKDYLAVRMPKIFLQGLKKFLLLKHRL